MMDLGATICTPRKPACGICPLADRCKARLEGRPERYPMKLPKAEKPKRQGIAYWLEHQGDVLLVRRPGKGLLGGMLALPTGEWASSASPGDGAPAAANWNEAGAVDHVFTHFALSLRLFCAEAEARNEGIWWPIDRIEEAGLPTVFSKAAARAASWRHAA
jgi:A/G-specific adenine glycosylase